MAELIDHLIARVAAKNFGLITRQQLLDLGLSSTAIQNRIRIGLLHRVFPGVYAVGAPPRLPIQRAAAAILAGGGSANAALAGGGAMTLWDFWTVWEEPLEIVILKGDRRPANLIVHRARNLAPADLGWQRGLRVTTPARALLDIAARRDDAQYKADVNNALHSKYLSKGDIADIVARHPRHPAAHRLAYFVTTKGGPTRSDWERRLPGFCTSQGLPEPVMALGQAGHTPDASWPELGIVLELDSWEYHNTRVDFEADHDRDLNYYANDLLPVRLTWELMIHRPDQTGERLREIVALRRRCWRRAA